VLRVLVPFVYNVSPELKVGVSRDYVRAGMDLQMTAPGAQLGSMVTGGTMAPGVPGVMTATTMGRFDFSDSSDYTGAASGSGFAGNLGIVYQASPELSVGASYHAKTSMSDLEGGTTMTFYNISMAGNGVVDTPEFAMKGNISVKDFQWPSTLGLGVNYQVSDALSIAADFKKINWSEVMKDFKMTFTADTNVNYGGFSGGTLDVTMPQNWDDQTVISIGGAYAMNDQLTLRAGYNSSSNPVPDMYMNPLFPATIEKHITFGLGYGLSDKSSIDFSMTSAPEVSATNGSGQTVKHSQTNWQFMYSVKY
jgi:long-chain fatty acid transport protein